MALKIKASPWLLVSGIIFTLATLYWHLRHPEDTIGIVIYATVAVLFYIGAIGNWKSGN